MTNPAADQLTVVAARIPRRDADALRALAERNDSTPSALMRDVVREHLRQTDQEDTDGTQDEGRTRR